MPAPITLTGTGLFNATGTWSSSYDAVVALTPANKNFGALTPLGAPLSKTFFLRNTGTNGGLSAAFALTGDTSQFKIATAPLAQGQFNGITTSPCGSALAGDALSATACTATDVSVDPAYGHNHIVVTVTYAPTVEGSHSVVLTPTSTNGSVMPVPLTLSGVGAALYKVSTSTSSLAYGNVSIGGAMNLTTRVTNTGQASLTTPAIALTGSLRYAASHNCLATLAVGAYCDVTVTFSPLDASSASGSLSVGYSQTSAQTVSLTGTGVAATGDPYFTSVSLLLNGDGAQGSTSFIDTKGASITGVGAAQISTARVKFGTGSIALNGTNAYLRAPTSAASLSFGTADFTVESWVYLNAAPSSYAGIVETRSLDSESSWLLGVRNTGGPRLDFLHGGATLTSRMSVPLSTWTHVAVTRSAGTFRLFINGVLDANTAVYAGAINSTTTAPLIGYGVSSYYLNGNLDDLRVTKGVARYTANFSVPVTAFSAPSEGPLPASSTQMLTTSATVTVPAGAVTVQAWVVGAGGGGGGAGPSDGSAGSGGGAGGGAYQQFAVTPGQTLSVIVGAGGLGSVSCASPQASAGGNSSLTVASTTLTGGGGSGGRCNGAAGAGGAGSGGTTVVAGGAGGSALGDTGGGGGGGVGAANLGPSSVSGQTGQAAVDFQNLSATLALAGNNTWTGLGGVGPGTGGTPPNGMNGAASTQSGAGGGGAGWYGGNGGAGLTGGGGGGAAGYTSNTTGGPGGAGLVVLRFQAS